VTWTVRFDDDFEKEFSLIPAEAQDELIAAAAKIRGKER